MMDDETTDADGIRREQILAGKVALITGGSRGLGREMAFAMARAGADVVVSSRKVDVCAETAEAIELETGRRAFPVACHVGRWEEVGNLVDATIAELGRIDILVNNAGMSPLYSDLESVSEELFDKVLAVNLKGPFRLCALAGARMAEGNGGSIINISSIAAERPTPREVPYSAAKAGLDVLTAGFAQAYGPKVRVNSVRCGPFLTDISEAWGEEMGERIARSPLARGGRPDEIVGTALYLASDASSFMTGAVLRLDGGDVVAT